LGKQSDIAYGGVVIWQQGQQEGFELFWRLSLLHGIHWVPLGSLLG
jgi:hypothetical protein